MMSGVSRVALLLLSVVALFSCSTTVISAQSVNVSATWISGTSTVNSPSVLGTVGVASTSIYPGGRLMPCMAVTVQDSNYQIYVYGGQGYATATLAFLKDFWRYNVATTEWTMLPENPSTATPAFGSRGVEGSAVFPTAVARTACLINPRDNRLYLFGGVGTGVRYNDMWMYNPTSGYWAWLGGGSGTTPSLGVESSTIYPASRRNTAMVGHPSQNILVVASGSGADLSGNAGDNNDMWKFNLDTNSWTWFAGSVTALAVNSVFDIKGAATSANLPGGRNMHTAWINPSTAIMYLFGGMTGTGTAYFNDMWSYDFTTGYWTWISGGTGSNIAPTYGSSAVFDATYTPGSRSSTIMAKVYNTNYLSVYGGRGYGINAATYNANLNELWFFDYSINQWAWIVGANEANTYGTKGVTSSGPYPQGRNLYASVSLAFQRSQMIFSGFLSGNSGSYLSDLWRLDYNVSVVSPIAASSSSSPIASSTLSSSMGISSSVSTSISTSSTASGAVSTGIAAGTTTSASSTAVTSSSSSRSSSRSSSTSSSRITSALPTSTIATSTTADSSATIGPDSSQQQATDAGGADIGAMIVRPEIIAAIVAAVIVLALLVFKVVQCQKRRRLAGAADVEYSGSKLTKQQSGTANAVSESEIQASMPMSNLPTKISVTKMSAPKMSAPSSASVTMNTTPTVTYCIPAELKADATYDFKCDQVIGEDGNVKFYSGTAMVPQLQRYGPAVLIKVVAEFRGQLSQADAEAFDHELSVLNMVSNRHAHIVSLLAWAEQPMAILTKLFTQGTLDQWIANRVVTTKSIKLGFWTDISRGLAFLHESLIGHGDVRLCSIFVDLDAAGRPFCLLGNFGAAKVFSQRKIMISPSIATESIWTAYAAPEVILRFHHGLYDNQLTNALQADMFALGVVAMELLANGPAWPADL